MCGDIGCTHKRWRVAWAVGALVVDAVASVLFSGGRETPYSRQSSTQVESRLITRR